MKIESRVNLEALLFKRHFHFVDSLFKPRGDITAKSIAALCRVKVTPLFVFNSENGKIAPCIIAQKYHESKVYRLRHVV